MIGIMSTNNTTDIMNVLPDEILLHVINKLDRQSLINFCHTNMLFARLVLEHLLVNPRKNILLIDRIFHCENLYVLDHAYKTYKNPIMFNFLWYTTKKISVIKWLCNTNITNKSKNTMYLSLRNGSFNVSTWLFKNIPKSHVEHMINETVYRGDLNMIKWLHDHEHETTTQICTTEAMDLAAEYGHLHVLNWLHVYRTEGCTTNAMDIAAKKGYIQVLDWLHTHRYEGCTKNALIMAIEEEHTCVVDWFIINKPDQFPLFVIMNEIIMHGNLKLFKYFFNKYPGAFPENYMHFAIMHNQLDIVKWCFQSNIVFDLTTCMDIACRYGYTHITIWLYSNSTIQDINTAISKANKQKTIFNALYLWFSSIDGYAYPYTRRSSYSAQIYY